MRSIKKTSYGVGLRNEHILEFYNKPKLPDIDFLEITPDNWMGIKGFKENILENISQKYKLIAHGLSLSIMTPEN